MSAKTLVDLGGSWDFAVTHDGKTYPVHVDDARVSIDATEWTYDARWDGSDLVDASVSGCENASDDARVTAILEAIEPEIVSYLTAEVPSSPR